jgi:hypothetical protein
MRVKRITAQSDETRKITLLLQLIDWNYVLIPMNRKERKRQKKTELFKILMNNYFFQTS